LPIIRERELTVWVANDSRKAVPMDADEVLSRMTIPNPCSMDWERMRGDERWRHCESCGKEVYDLTAMKSSEAGSVLDDAGGGEICGRVLERADGTLVVSDCQSVPAAPLGPWQFRIRALMGVVAGVATSLGIARALTPPEPPPRPKPPAPVRGIVMGLLTRASEVNLPVNNPGCSVPE
jgi:hypothetical protein